MIDVDLQLVGLQMKIADADTRSLRQIVTQLLQKRREVESGEPVALVEPIVDAVRCELTSSQQATIVNVVARGLHGDIDAGNGGGGCRASNTNLRPSLSPALALGTGIQSGDPLLAPTTGRWTARR